LKPDTPPSAEPPAAHVLDRDWTFRGRLISVHVDRLRLPDGREVVREVVAHPGAVAIVALPSPDSAILVRQYRHPAEADLWEIPAGKIEAGESPLRCAQRELEEETGRRAATWTALPVVFTTPGFTNERIFLFAATDLERSGDAPPDPDRDVVSCAIFQTQTLQRMLETGELLDAKTLLGLLWMGLIDPSG
jgi:ADP-ribose pyrophosphatase